MVSITVLFATNRTCESNSVLFGHALMRRERLGAAGSPSWAPVEMLLAVSVTSPNCISYSTKSRVLCGDQNRFWSDVIPENSRVRPGWNESSTSLLTG